jgi:hypothetical protein
MLRNVFSLNRFQQPGGRGLRWKTGKPQKHWTKRLLTNNIREYFLCFIDLFPLHLFKMRI